MVRLLCLLIGYAFGLIETAYFYGKANGIDIREHGSGNAGTTNTLRVLGKKAGAIVLAGDLFKCMIAILVTWLLFHNAFPDEIYLIKIYTAAGVILGHDFPFYMKFRGGKGIACTGGMVLAFFWGIIPGEVAIFFGIFFLTQYVSLASVFMYIGFLIQVILFGQNGFFVGLTQANLYEMYAIVTALTAIALWQHRKNIVRLWNNEENKTVLFKKKNNAKETSEN